MKKFTYFFALVLLFMTSFNIQVIADTTSVSSQVPAPGDVIIVEISRGDNGPAPIRIGFDSQNDPIEFNYQVREAYDHHETDFRNLMNEVYTRLNVTNRADHPVLLLEPDSYNSWRRVTYANIIMGENQAPWIYVMWHAMIGAYGFDDGTASSIVYNVNANYSELTPVIGGWPHDIPYAVYFNYHEPDLNRRADSVFWTSVTCPYYARLDLLKNIILAGDQWNNITASEITQFEERIDYQKIEYSHKAIVRSTTSPRKFLIWHAGKKICDDGILLDWDLAFQQSLFQEKGADEIRIWVF